MDQYIISGRPSLQLKQIITTTKPLADTFPFNQKKIFFFFSGRYALAAAMEALQFKAGDKLLLPAYNCGVEIDPVLHSGVDPVYYNINKNMLVDLDDLALKLDTGAKGILVTHFLGFPQPIEEIKYICNERGVFLIEDCAHALLSRQNGKSLGCHGDASIFSLLKTLPIPNGGLLLLNSSNYTYKKQMKPPNAMCALFFSAEVLKNKTRDFNHRTKEYFITAVENSFCSSAYFLRILVAASRKFFGTNGLALIRPDSFLFEKGITSWGISTLSRRIIGNTDFEYIKRRRRMNYQYLLDHFFEKRRAMLIFEELPPSVCPLFFPLLVETESKRELLYKTLKQRGITTHPWWDRFHPEVPWAEFPDAVYLKTRLMGLPIHQDLTLSHLDHLIEQFEKIYSTLTEEPKCLK